MEYYINTKKNPIKELKRFIADEYERILDDRRQSKRSDLVYAGQTEELDRIMKFIRKFEVENYE